MLKQKYFFALILTVTLTSLKAQGKINGYDKEGKRHGYWTKNFPNSLYKRYEGYFLHGKEIDTFKYYKVHEGKSVLSAIKVFNKDNAQSNITFFASNGKIITTGTTNGKLYIGKWLYYHNNSDRVMIEEFYNDNGKLQGPRSVYYPNGNIAETATYANGLLEGVVTNYNEAGKILKITHYKSDKLNGYYIVYDTNGNIEVKGTYKNDVKVGVWNTYRNGTLIETTDYTKKTPPKKK